MAASIVAMSILPISIIASKAAGAFLPAVEAQARDAHHRELHGEDVSLLAGRKVARRAMHGRDE
jgi:hypothetical protein